MANETEIERLVVRLVGDDSSYRSMMTGAATATGELTTVSTEVVNAQEQVDSSLVQSTTSLDRFTTGGRGASRSINFLGMQTMRAGMMISSFNAPLGEVIINLGSVTTAAGQTLRGFNAFNTLGRFGPMMSAMFASPAAPFLAAAGATVAAMGVAYYAASHSVDILGESFNRLEKAAKEADKAIDEARKRHTTAYRNMALYEPEEQSSLSKNQVEIDRHNFEVASKVRQDAVSKLEEDKSKLEAAKNAPLDYTLPNASDPGVVELAHALAIDSAEKNLAESKRDAATATGLESRAQNALTESTGIYLGQLDKQITLLYAAAEAGDKYAASQTEIEKKTRAKQTAGMLQQANFEAEKAIWEADRYRSPAHQREMRVESQFFGEDLSDPKSKSAYADALRKAREADAAEEKASIQQETDYAKEYAAAIMLGGEAKVRALAEAGARKAGYDDDEAGARADIAAIKYKAESLLAERAALQASSNAMEDMVGRGKEVLSPLDQQLSITNAVAKAKRDYFATHQEAMPVALQNQIALNEAEKVHLRLVEEGRAVYEKFQEPLDRIIQDQIKLKQQFDAGGFGKGEKGAKAYQKALAAAYGEAHKLWQGEMMGQQFDALVGGTSAATRALYEYKLGSTAIPLNQMGNAKPADKKDEPLLAPVNKVAAGIERLVALEEKRAANKPMEIALANL